MAQPSIDGESERMFRGLLLDMFIRETRHAHSRSDYLEGRYRYVGSAEEVLPKLQNYIGLHDAGTATHYGWTDAVLLEYLRKDLADYQHLFYR